MNIHFFGASVTAQGRHHKTNVVTGYYEHIKDYYRDSCISIHRTAAGSSHFDQAGYCLLDQVLESKPDLVFLDWHSTSADRFNEVLFRSALAKIAAAGALTIMGIFPRRSWLSRHMERPNIALAYQYASEQIRILDLYSRFDSDILTNSILRDECHTSVAGAEMYSREIISMIDSTIKHIDLTRPNGDCKMDKISEIIPVSKFSFPLPCEKISEFSLNIMPGSSTLGYCSLVLEHEVGPFSPVCILSDSLGYCKEFSIWDSYCHYSRKTFSALPGHFKPIDQNRYSINIRTVDRLPNYNISRQPFDYSTIKNRYILPISVYCIGGTISGCTYSGNPK